MQFPLDFVERDALTSVKLCQALTNPRYELDLASDLLERRFFWEPLKQVLDDLLIVHASIIPITPNR